MSDLEELLASFESSLGVSAVPESVRRESLLRATGNPVLAIAPPTPATRSATHGKQAFNLPLPISLGHASVSQASTQGLDAAAQKPTAAGKFPRAHARLVQLLLHFQGGKHMWWRPRSACLPEGMVIGILC